LNCFDGQNAAQRYSAAHPYFHPSVIEKIKNYIGISAQVSQALDLVCGAGQSTEYVFQVSTQPPNGVDSWKVATHHLRVLVLPADQEGSQRLWRPVSSRYLASPPPRSNASKHKESHDWPRECDRTKEH
jgi:hypothetical protein